MQVVIRLLPFIAFAFAFIAWLFAMVGCVSFGRGWAVGEDDDSYEIGWREDSDGGAVGPNFEDAGQAAFIGNVLAFFFLLLTCAAALMRGFGIARGCACFGCGTAVFGGSTMFLAWTIWLDETEGPREELNLAPHYALYLCVVGSLLAFASAIIMGVAFYKDWILYPRGYEED